MAKIRRNKITIEKLEAVLEKTQRRIMTLSENAYKVRQIIAELKATPKKEPFVKKKEEEETKNV